MLAVYRFPRLVVLEHYGYNVACLHPLAPAVLPAERARLDFLNGANRGLAICFYQTPVAGNECLHADGFWRRQGDIPSGPLDISMRGFGSKHRAARRVAALQEKIELFGGYLVAVEP
jgi:hypothetical protein